MISEQILHPSGTDDTSTAPPAAAEPPAIAPVADEPRPETVEAPPAPPTVAPVLDATLTVEPAPAAEPVVDLTLTAEPVPAETPHAVIAAALTAWNWTACAARVLNGVRTLLFFAVTGLLALGTKLADVDLSGTVSALTGRHVDASDIAIFMSIGGIVLRFLTKTQVFDRWRKAAQGDKPAEASAAVDEPEDN